MTFGSLFAGIGGFDLGLERAGMECRWQVEIDDYASRVLAKHWPHVTRWGDVRTFPPGPAEEWKVDLVCAGVPCQPVSHAGKQKGADDERWMWGEALRVVADLQPTFFVAENPIGILNHDGGRTFRGLLRALASVGYVCEWHVIAACSVGAPHRRERVWLVCFRNRHGAETNASCANSDCLGSHRPRKHIDGETQLCHKQDGFAGSLGGDVAYADRISCTAGQPRRAGGRVPAAGSGSQGRQDKGQAWAIAGSCGANVAHTDSRRLKVERLAEHGDEQGPLGHIFDGCSPWGWWQGPQRVSPWWSAEPDVGRVAHGIPNRVDRLRCLGNAVVPQIVELIGRAIIQSQEVEA
jgi:DNA (cytosine-5)-methyltransferase 1